MTDKERIAALKAQIDEQGQKIAALTPRPAPASARFAIPPIPPNVASVNQPMSEEEQRLAREVFGDNGLKNYLAGSINQGGGAAEIERRARLAQPTTQFSARPGPSLPPHLEQQIAASDRIVSGFEAREEDEH